MDKDRGNRSHIIDALTVVVFWKACRAVGDICPFFCSHHTEVLLVDVAILLEHWGRKFRTWTAELLRYPLGGRKLPASVSHLRARVHAQFQVYSSDRAGKDKATEDRRKAGYQR